MNIKVIRKYCLIISPQESQVNCILRRGKSRYGYLFLKSKWFSPFISRLKVVLQMYPPYHHLIHQYQILFALTFISCKSCYSWKDRFNWCIPEVHMLILFILIIETIKRWAMMVASFKCTDIDCRFAVEKCDFLSIVNP